MEQIKRSRINIAEGDYNNKRKKVPKSSEESITHFEDLSNEIIYEIFEFLDFDYVYEAFSNLNQRFYNLIINSKLPIKINISFKSKSNFQRYYTDIIIPYIHRIKSLRISNQFTVNTILSSLDDVSKFIRLETIILDQIESPFLTNINYLITLPRLYSLVIVSGTDVQNQAKLFYQIFQLPVLRYCKVSFGENFKSVLLPIAKNKYSPIKHLVINDDIPLALLYCILSYVPQLCRLSIHLLYNSGEKRRQKFPIVLNHLTHMSIRFSSINFNTFELFIKNLSHNLQLLCITTNHDITYLDADRWQNLILSYLPNLRIFDFQYIYSVGSDKNVAPTYENLINKFNSSFWIERQWFFATEYPCGLYQYNIIFYSTKPYRRRNLILHGIIEKNNFDSVHHIHIKSIRAMINCMNYFPNITKLTFSDHFDTICDSIGSKLTHIVPVKQINELVIDYSHFSFMQIVQLLSFMENIHTLKLVSMSFNEIDSATIQQNQIFQLVSMTNTVTNMIMEGECSLEGMNLLITLCPRLKHLTMNGFLTTLIPITRLLLSKNNNNTRHLSSLCVLKMNYALEQTFKIVIELDNLLDNCSIKFVNHKLYLWW